MARSMPPAEKFENRGSTGAEYSASLVLHFVISLLIADCLKVPPKPVYTLCRQELKRHLLRRNQPSMIQSYPTRQ